ncbi:MAG: efflux RND transporter periplasmic adaptor subunit [Deltaproteobacteria bacterium]|nr:efflux RND transporter periplasmic adaptor subunit [Deltaproteobacteria bacterium]
MRFALAALALVACNPVARDTPRETAAPVATAAPAPRAVAAPSYVGVVTTTEAVDVAPAIEAALVSIAVRPGDEVAAGQVVAELDPRAVRRDLKVAEAALAEASAARRAAAVEVANAGRILASERRAVAAGVSPRRAVEDAQAEVARTRASRDRADASVTEARAQVDAIRVLLDDTAVRAPFAGVIALRYREVGDTAGPRSPIVRVNKRDGLRLRFGVPPDDARALRAGQRVVAQLDTLATPLDATIDHVAPEVDAPSRLVFVDAVLALADATPALQPGLAAHVRVP